MQDRCVEDGALLETSSKIAPGTAIDLRVIGQDVNLCVPARMMRTEVAAVDARGVRYRVAAAFVSGLEIRGLEAPAAPGSATPDAIAELLTRVLRNNGQRSNAAVRADFEDGLRRLLPVQDIQIRHRPIIPAAGFDSIYFKVPLASNSPPILQAVFEPNHQPTANEFRLLTAAATLTAVLLESAPLY